MGLFTRSKEAAPAVTCPHFSGQVAKAASQTCQECDSGFNLRVCTECGHVGCCESQKGHNKAHFHQSGHPVIKSMPVTEGAFTWCYECRKYIG